MRPSKSAGFSLIQVSPDGVCDRDSSNLPFDQGQRTTRTATPSKTKRAVCHSRQKTEEAFRQLVVLDDFCAEPQDAN
ncbi:uncharacterized protein SPSK_04665 [Sporothrix schenckii 1099-18]|uniref:Uncharacterized protein n=1 Tax=Sporothrix schenckii 1099-18 TaxID=1397361 RepID=A0A0F2M0U3_SPOSC|nr:uncharacterized protein SPSK_04665 [Sporothrix schenckii 1099-18]KJR83333.1 hypothetical protein SPSK_04665 [Sporothrix schenckii 1099-18]